MNPAEISIHNIIREAVQKCRDDFGIQISSVSLEWIDTSTVAEDRATVKTVRMVTTSTS